MRRAARRSRPPFAPAVAAWNADARAMHRPYRRAAAPQHDGTSRPAFKQAQAQGGACTPPQTPHRQGVAEGEAQHSHQSRRARVRRQRRWRHQPPHPLRHQRKRDVPASQQPAARRVSRGAQRVARAMQAEATGTRPSAGGRGAVVLGAVRRRRRSPQFKGAQVSPLCHGQGLYRSV
ncbi:hypothetical protein FGB62_140g120 [Gracilaria domingensis]|nr:hypothetical protein FGB62_140g120 [Gracilaria domingensis]